MARLTCTPIYDLHLQDAGNLQHPSYFEATAQSDMLIFRTLATGETPAATPPRKTTGLQLQEIVTRPITFFVFDRRLVTVRTAHSRTVEQGRARLAEPRARRASEPP
ncbi:MAG: magnesium transporter, partial [Betaproteobacteria bacterium]